MPGETQLPASRVKPKNPTHDAVVAAAKPTAPTGTTVVARLRSADGESIGPPLNLPADVDASQLNALLNSLLQNDDPLPYSFFVDDTEILSTLERDIVAGAGKSTEDVFEIVYRPQAVFRVRAVTRCSSSMPGHTEAVLAVSFSPCGTMLASGSGDTSVRVWDIHTETPQHTLSGHANWVQCIAWSPDTKVLASGSMDKTVRLWDPRTGKALGQPLRGHTQAITSLAWEPFHLNKGACNRLASASRDGTVRVWNTANRRMEFACAQHTAPVTCVRWGGPGLLYTASRDKTIKVWCANTGKLIRSLNGHAHWINHLALSTEWILRTGPWGARAVLTGARDIKPEEFNIIVGGGVAFANVKATDISTPEGRERARVLAERAYKEVLKQQQVAGKEAAGNAAKTVSDNSDDAAPTLASSSGKERLVSCSDDFTMFIWSPQDSKKPITRMTGHQQLVNHVSFSPNGRLVASASFDKSVKLWDPLANGKFLANLRGHVGAVYHVCWSADSRLLVSSSRDSTLKLWDVKSRTLKEDLPGHADEVYAVDWSPEGAKVASGGKDRVLKVWKH